MCAQIVMVNPSRLDIAANELSPAIRDATPSERPLLESLQVRASLTWKEQAAAILAQPDLNNIPDEFFRDGTVRVAVILGEIVGFAIVLPKGSQSALLDGLFVEPACMGKGVGTRLVADARARARAAGATVLDVVAKPQAVGFYEKVGFTQVGSAATRFGPARRLRWFVA